MTDDTRVLANVVVGGAVCLAFGWLLVCMVAVGWANTIDRIAIKLHRHAVSTRARFSSAESELYSEWAVELSAVKKDNKITPIRKKASGS